MFLAPHPLLLEYSFPSSSDNLIAMKRRSNAEREAELVCNSLINFPMAGMPSHRLSHYWIKNPATENVECVLAQELYTWPGAQFLADAFSPVDSIAPLSLTEPWMHYTRDAITIGQSIDLPATLPAILEIYCQLSDVQKQRFLRGAYWLQHAEHVLETSISGSFMSLVQAIEAIMPYPEQGERCPTCDRPQNRSATDRFAEFVDHHAQNVIAQDIRKRFYRTRSAVIHGGKLLYRDNFPLDIMAPQGRVQANELHLLSRIVRIVFHNWLVRQAGG
jgi:hypothetical protein